MHENDDRVWFDLLQVGFKILAGGGFSKPIPGGVYLVVYVEFGGGSGGPNMIHHTTKKLIIP